MISARRYRIYLVVGSLSILTLYYLTKSAEWDSYEYNGARNVPIKQDKSYPDTPVLSTRLLNPSPAAPRPSDYALLTGASSQPSTSTAPTALHPVTAVTSRFKLEPLPPSTYALSTAHLPPTQSGAQRPPLQAETTLSSTETAEKAYWQPFKEQFPVPQDQLIALPLGKTKHRARIQYEFKQETPQQNKDRLSKRAAIREAFDHAWKAYRTYALPHDELKPLTESYGDPFNGWGATLVDSLDTLWIMGFKEEFDEAVKLVGAIDFTTSPRKDIPLFETTIRYLGGLLGAYDVSAAQYPTLLNKAVELADILMGAFDTPNRMPSLYYRWRPSDAAKLHRSDTNAVVAELGTLSLEFTRLAQITKKTKYYDAVARITNELHKWQMSTEMPGLWPLRLDSSGCDKSSPPVVQDNTRIQSSTKSSAVNPRISSPKLSEDIEPDSEPVTAESFANRHEHKRDLGEIEEAKADCRPQGLKVEFGATRRVYGIGAMGDSLYEYMPKMHNMLGGLSQQYRGMYANAREAIQEHLLFRPMTKEEDRNILFHAKHELTTQKGQTLPSKRVIYEGTHLGCFAGGMFALGSVVFNYPSDMDLAAKLTDGCVWAYGSMPTGVMPEEFTLVPCEKLTSCKWNESRWHAMLDPYEAERVQIAELYNDKQRKLADGRTAVEQGPTATADPDSAKGSSSLSPSSPAFKPYHKKRDVPLDDINEKVVPAKTVPSGSTVFGSKEALSHAKYVAARIAEDRLPPGYTEVISRDYRLRPEAIESVFIMYRMTGQQKWRDKGWAMFEATDRATRTLAGYGQLKDVTSQLSELADKMESFWLAETLKYYYLLFSEPELVSLDEYVLNTEAHPLKLPVPESEKL